MLKCLKMIFKKDKRNNHKNKNNLLRNKKLIKQIKKLQLKNQQKRNQPKYNQKQQRKKRIKIHSFSICKLENLSFIKKSYYKKKDHLKPKINNYHKVITRYIIMLRLNGKC